MDEEVALANELDNQILAPTTNGTDLLTLERCGHRFRRLGTCQARVGDLHALQTAADEPWSQTRTDRLDLGELGHGAGRFPSGDDVQHDRPWVRPG